MRHDKWILSAVLVLMTTIPSLYAVDGVILIDQSRALAGNATPGDTPGFPVTISQPGSYRLSGNLTVPAGQNAILITAASNVTIDLNGFSISAPIAPGGAFTRGVLYSGSDLPKYITIRNGTFNGFTHAFFLFDTTGRICQYCSFSDLIANWGPGGSALDLGKRNRMHNVTHDGGINAYCPSVVTNSVASYIAQSFGVPGDPNLPNEGSCTFAHNATVF